ncbi:MAG: diacylglycerol/polyprenol kinase family protein [Candidatus Helarchaeota archaeon]
MPFYGAVNIANGIQFLVIAVLLLFVVRKSVKNSEAKYSTFITAILCIVLGVYVTISGFFVVIVGQIVAPINSNAFVYLNFRFNPYPSPMSGIIIFLNSVIIVYIMIYAFFEHYIKKDYETEEAQLKALQQQAFKNNPLDLEISRKLFHSLVNGFIVCYLFVGALVFEAIYDYVVNIDPFMKLFFGSDVSLVNHPELLPIVGKSISSFVLSIIFYICILTDLVRIYKFRYYPIKEVGNMIRTKERNVFGPHVYLITGMLVAVLLFPPVVAMVAISISALGDAMATIVGITLGKRRVHPNHPETRKTWEGCLGGIIGSFVFGLISYFIMATYYFGTINLTIIIAGILMSLAGAGVFFIIDYFSPPLKVSDNVVNPVLCGIVGLIIFGLFFPAYTFGFYFIP